jgi:hypothetical protein
MSVTYIAGSTVPTSADLDSLMGQTIGASTPNDLAVITLALQRKVGWSGYPPATQPEISTLLP